MLIVHDNIQVVLDRLRKVAPALRKAQRAAMDSSYWRARALASARAALDAISLEAEKPYIHHFMAGITCRASEDGFTLQINPPDASWVASVIKEVRGIPNLALFTSVFGRSDVDARDIILDWVTQAKEIRDIDHDAGGGVDYEQIADRIYGILFRPVSEVQFAAREKLLQSGDPKRRHLLDFAAEGGAAEKYGITEALARRWLDAVGNAWQAMAASELPARMLQLINAAIAKV